MKIHWNQKYTTIAIYACIVASLTVLCIFLGIHIKEVFSWFGWLINLLNPLIIGFVLAYLINPLVTVLEKYVFRPRSKGKKHTARPVLRRGLSMITAYLVLAVFLAVLSALVIPQVILSYNSFMSQSDRYISTLESWIRELGERYSFINIEKASDYLADLVTNWYRVVQMVIPYIVSFFTGFLAQLRNVVLGLVLSGYFLVSKEKLFAQLKKVMYAVLPAGRGDRILDFLHFTDKTFGGFVLGKLLDSLIIGILTLIVLAIFQMPYYQLVSVIVGVTNIIPFFGPFIGAIPSAIIIFFADPNKAFLFVILIIIIQQLDGNLIGPKIMGQKVGLSALGVILAITLMGGLFGFAGMMIGVPLFALIYVGFARLLNRRLKSQDLKGEEEAAAENAPPEEKSEPSAAQDSDTPQNGK